MTIMADHEAGESALLVSTAYVEFFVKRDRASLRLMERDRRRIARHVGNFALYLMDAVYLPAVHGVGWMDSWVEVDSLTRVDPQFRAALKRRDRYRRMGLGYTLLPRHRLRRTADEVSDLLWLAAQADGGPGVPVLWGTEAVLAMLHKYRARFEALPFE